VQHCVETLEETRFLDISNAPRRIEHLRLLEESNEQVATIPSLKPQLA
jgi:hypothetical protein